MSKFKVGDPVWIISEERPAKVIRSYYSDSFKPLFLVGYDRYTKVIYNLNEMTLIEDLANASQTEIDNYIEVFYRLNSPKEPLSALGSLFRQIYHEEIAELIYKIDYQIPVLRNFTPIEFPTAFIPVPDKKDEV